MVGAPRRSRSPGRVTPRPRPAPPWCRTSIDGLRGCSSAARARPVDEPARARHPIRRVGEPTLGGAHHTPTPAPCTAPGRGARLLGAGELLGDLGAHLTGIHAGIRGRQRLAKLNRKLGGPRARHTSPRPQATGLERRATHARLSRRTSIIARGCDTTIVKETQKSCDRCGAAVNDSSDARAASSRRCAAGQPPRSTAGIVPMRPALKSSTAWRISSRVFITNGP